MIHRVAIITRTKDRPIMLARAIESVLGQSHQDWLHVIVNDGGNQDEVDSLINKHRKAYGERVQVIHHEHSHGMEAASNAGIAASETLYIVIHDDDDTWDPDFLKVTTDFLDHRDGAAYGGVVTQSRIVNERIEGGLIKKIDEASFNSYLTSVTLAQVACRNVFTVNAFLFRRSVLNEIGPYDDQLKVLGDWEFNLRFLSRYDIAVIPRALAFYHHRVQDQDSIYANTVIAGANRHADQEARLRNRLLRADLEKVGSGVGLLTNLADSLRFDLRERQEHDIMEARLKQADAYIKTMLAQVQDVHERNGRLATHLSHVEGQLAEASGRAQRLEHELQRIRASFFWRATGPLRILLRRLRRR